MYVCIYIYIYIYVCIYIYIYICCRPRCRAPAAGRMAIVAQKPTPSPTPVPKNSWGLAEGFPSSGLIHIYIYIHTCIKFPSHWGRELDDARSGNVFRSLTTTTTTTTTATMMIIIIIIIVIIIIVRQRVPRADPPCGLALRAVRHPLLRHHIYIYVRMYVYIYIYMYLSLYTIYIYIYIYIYIRIGFPYSYYCNIHLSLSLYIYIYMYMGRRGIRSTTLRGFPRSKTRLCFVWIAPVRSPSEKLVGWSADRRAVHISFSGVWTRYLPHAVQVRILVCMDVESYIIFYHITYQYYIIDIRMNLLPLLSGKVLTPELLKQLVAYLHFGKYKDEFEIRNI